MREIIALLNGHCEEFLKRNRTKTLKVLTLSSVSHCACLNVLAVPCSIRVCRFLSIKSC